MEKDRIKLNKGWELHQVGTTETDWLAIRKMPSQVADILLDHEILTEEVKLGWCQEAQWISDYEWEYRCCFERPKGKRSRLIFKGLDTLATIYLNGKEIGSHDDFYLPDSIEISDLCQDQNTLLIRFHRVMEWLAHEELPTYLEDAVLKCKLLRKPLHDFPLKNGPDESSYQGAVPGFTPVGVYDDIILETWDDMEITDENIQAKLIGDRGEISFAVEGVSEDNTEVQILVKMEGCIIKDICVEAKVLDGGYRAEGCIYIENPKLWNPIGFGRQELYTIELLVRKSGEILTEDRIEKTVGFRRIEMPVPLAFIINGKKVRLWGGSMDPMQGYTHCYQKERAERIFDMVENANMNTLRIWGEGIPLPDEFYEEADRRGILIWQEFFMGHGAYPDNEEYGMKCVKEAEVLVRRLRHHASLLMWCGGNETIMGAELIGKYPFGDWIAKSAFPEMLRRLDPERYYHVNSPYGGEWTNDPREGDSHTYECIWEYPYQEYPNFLSESIRTAPPARYSLEKIIRGALWEPGYDGKVTRPGQGIMPENWRQRIHLLAGGERYSGNYWEYYDVTDADSMLYRFGASYGAAIKRIGEQVRKGSREKADFTKRSKGYMACKLLDTWPKVFCAIIDYFQEGYIPYYATKRVLSPVMVQFSREESLRLYAVNDSAEDFHGMIETGLYNLRTEQLERREFLPVCVEQGDCELVNDLAHYLFFSKDCILFARLMDKAGRDIYTCIDYVDIERHLPFEDPEISVAIQGNVLSIKALHFARCVEITGNCDGNEFGWLFDDNYFDLLPGMTKNVRILGKQNHGTISVKAPYSKNVQQIRFCR